MKELGSKNNNLNITEALEYQDIIARELKDRKSNGDQIRKFVLEAKKIGFKFGNRKSIKLDDISPI